jgi:hypothetical protein
MGHPTFVTGAGNIVIPSEAEGSAVLPTANHSQRKRRPLTLSSRPERTRISCHAALDIAACAAFRKESRMKFASATNLDRKSGVAEWRDLRFLYLPSNEGLLPSSPVLPAPACRVGACVGYNTTQREVLFLNLRS